MVNIYQIEEVTNNAPHNRWEIYTKSKDLPDRRFIIPHITFAARAAEYGINPTDINLLLDIALHELDIEVSHFTNPGLTEHEADDFVYNTDEITAQKALHQRIARVKNEKLQVEDPNNMLQEIKDWYKVDISRHISIKKHVAHIRQEGMKKKGIVK